MSLDDQPVWTLIETIQLDSRGPDGKYENTERRSILTQGNAAVLVVVHGVALSLIEAHYLLGEARKANATITLPETPTKNPSTLSPAAPETT